jgi:predicted class III extradiol MEMO1 family dioxygenase
VTTTAVVTGWVRPPAVAGLFYAADPDRLRHDVVRHGQDGDRHGP